MVDYAAFCLLHQLLKILKNINVNDYRTDYISIEVLHSDMKAMINKDKGRSDFPQCLKFSCYSFIFDQSSRLHSNKYGLF